MWTIRVGLNLNNKNIKINKKLNFNKADWIKFKYLSQINLAKVDMRMDINEANLKICKIITEAADNYKETMV